MARDRYSHEATLCGQDVVVSVEEWESATSKRSKRAVRVITTDDRDIVVLDKRQENRGLASLILPSLPRSLPPREEHVQDTLTEAREQLSGASDSLRDDTAPVIEAVEELDEEGVFE